jgi:ribonuclease VapC
MIVDTSALLAILKYEKDWREFATAIRDARTRRISAANYVETAAVVDSLKDPITSRQFDELIRQSGIKIETVTEQQAVIARSAYRDFGKSSGHPARLNFGDCFAYALAKQSNEPLLFKGNDFAKTDVIPAIRKLLP